MMVVFPVEEKTADIYEYLLLFCICTEVDMRWMSGCLASDALKLPQKDEVVSFNLT